MPKKSKSKVQYNCYNGISDVQYRVYKHVCVCVCRLGEDEMEVGMGLHGEPGASTQKMQSANDIVKKVS